MGIIPCPNVDSRQLYDEIFSDDNLAKKTASRMEMAKELSDVYREYVFKRYEEYIKVAPHFEQLVVSNEISEDFKDILEYVFDHDSIFIYLHIFTCSLINIYKFRQLHFYIFSKIFSLKESFFIYITF